MEKRNRTFDLLRILSMLMIIILHEINKGLNLSDFNKVADYVNNYILALVFCSVNLFVLISAYFLCDDNQIKIRSIANLVVENWIINFIVVGVIYLINKNLFSTIDILYIAFPLFSRRNWFICVYLIMYLLHPYLNIIIKKISLKSYSILMIILVSAFSILPSVMPNRNWTFDKMYGYSIIWFVVLYITAAYLKIIPYVFKHKVHFYILLYFVLGIIMLLSKFVISSVSRITGIEVISHYKSIWYAYDTVPVYFMSVLLFSAFLVKSQKKKIWNHMFGNLISALGASTLGVYLIHDNYMLREYLWTNVIQIKYFSESFFSVGYYILIAIAVFIACAVLYIFLHKGLSIILNKLLFLNKKITIE